MLDSIENGEGIGEDSIPPYISALVDIHEDQESNEDLGQVQSDEFAEEGAELDHIERFTIIHEAAEDFGAIPQEVTDGFNAEPGTHESRTVLLVSKLEVVQAECVAEEEDHNPIEDLKNETPEGYRPIVFTCADISQFVFNDRNKS